MPEYPRQVRVELSSLCNSSCVFCHAHGDFLPMVRPKERMTIALFNQVLDDLESWPEPVEELVPTAWGELFLNREWAWMLGEISRRLPKTGIQIVTTGSLLVPMTLERLALVPTLKGINFSLNAFYTETWTKVHGLPAKGMQIAVEAVHAFRERRPDVKVNVSMVHQTDLQTELEKDVFESYWKQFGPVTVSNASFAGNPKHLPDPPVVMSCRSLFDGLAVLANGNVGTGCCFWSGDAEELSIGHFPEETLLSIWRGYRLQQLTNLHNTGRRAEIDLCRRCTFA